MTETLKPLEQETRAYLTTAEAAMHLNLNPQTLRKWACHETGPIRPRRITNRLMWPTAEIRRLLGLENENGGGCATNPRREC
jgi:hypothetical protein